MSWVRIPETVGSSGAVPFLCVPLIRPDLSIILVARKDTHTYTHKVGSGGAHLSHTTQRERHNINKT